MQEAELIEQLSRLKVYRDFEQAFYQVTELSVRLRTLGMWNLACALLNQEGRFSSITIVPVWLGENIIGVLQTDRAALEGPMSRELADQRPVANARIAKNSHRPSNGHIPVFSRPRYEAMVHLLQIFAEQLSFYANQVGSTRTVSGAGGPHIHIQPSGRRHQFSRRSASDARKHFLPLQNF